MLCCFRTNNDVQAVQPLIPEEDGEVAFELNGESFGVADVCQSPTVPSFFMPYTNTAESPFAWFEQGAYMSYGYR